VAVTHEARYAKTADGVYIAYQVAGSGPVDVAADFHLFAGNVDLIWDEPDWGQFLRPITDFARLILHDRRGSGASTRNVPPPNLETRAADLLAVLDEVGSDAPVLGAAASTGAMHALFAATYPERASGIVWNTRARGLRGLPTTRGDRDGRLSRQLSRKRRAGARRITLAT
jgi:pimeloyl-ACP methyl ester carboxylesterase